MKPTAESGWANIYY